TGKRSLREKDRRELMAVGGEEDPEEQEEGLGKIPSLLKMKFMKKAAQAQRELAKTEAATLLRELEAADARALRGEGDNDSSSGDEKEGKNGPTARAGGGREGGDMHSDPKAREAAKAAV
ncbi:unnamed protein product, partial [Discosporangium mesarthrocarpum]